MQLLKYIELLKRGINVTFSGVFHKTHILSTNLYYLTSHKDIAFKVFETLSKIILSSGFETRPFSFVIMSYTILDFEWNSEKESIKLYFHESILLGLKITAFSVVYKNKEFIITENIALEQIIIKSISF